MDAWRWRPGGAGGLGALATSWRGGDDLARPGRGTLVALSSWPVAVRRRASPCSRRVSLGGASGACRSWRGVARGVASAGFGCRGPKKRRRAEDTCRPPGCW